MPIQPFAATLRLKAGLYLLSMSPLPGTKLPASISSRRKARTSWRSCSASGGSVIESNWKLWPIGGVPHEKAFDP